LIKQEQKAMTQSTLPTQTQKERWLNLGKIVKSLELVQDLIVISLCLGLFSFMVLQIRSLLLSLIPPVEFHVVTADILSLLIWVELFRLLIIYLKEQRISIGVAVEVAIVSVLREVIVRGILETQWTQVLATCAFLLVLGILLIIRVWLPPTFEGVDPEQKVSERYKLSKTKSATNGHNLHVENLSQYEV
jgi:uncharacterized membrane protein (DUF373 family)